MRTTRLHPLGMGLRPLYLLLLQLLLQLLATWQVAETQTVLIIESVKLTILPGQHVASGTDVTLQCDPKITSGTGMPLKHRYTFYRDSDPVYGNATTTASSLPYVIRQARVANSGSYKCSVEVHGQYKESDPESLNVTGLQTPVLLLNKATVTEGEGVTASCSAPKETGSSFFFYFFEGSKEPKKVPTSENLAETQLKFSSPGNKSVTCHYRISLQPDLVTSSRSKPSRVYVQELSIRPHIEVTPNTNVIEGDTLQIACRVDGSRHKPSNITVYVSKDGIMKANGKGSIVYNTTVRASDSGLYECKAIMGDVVKAVNRSVAVSELFSRPVLTLKPPEAFEKESFSLACYSHNISSQRIQRGQVKYSLYRNGRVLTPGDFGGKFNTTAEASRNGNYSCDAVAKHIRKSSNVIVFKAKVLVSKPSIFVPDEVIVGKPFRIHCRCENGSLPVSYTLLSNKVPQKSVLVRQPNETASFLVTVRRKEDVRNFTCEAENNGYSSRTESRVLDAAVTEPVSVPTLLIMPNFGSVTEGEELFLACTVREGSPPFTLKWYRDGSDQPLDTQMTKDRTGLHVLGPARREHTGAYRCVADNPARDARRSKLVRVSVSLARWKLVLIVVSCILLLTVLIGVGCYRYRAQRGKRETATELSVKPSSPKSEDSLTVSLAHDTDAYSAHTGAASLFDSTDGRAANGTPDSVTSLPAHGSNRSSYSSPATG
ncbi:platelet endothelial cell adhesion molecule isoform X3 [Anguilla anguilla]|uniref:platelet endothelial cell adhesion molecule isoform X3 n=1 Tax=Anguilla anguilla TaxID=7936 RepID=UPI0015AA71CE|nr:platelet endothelial cell adhesion molecule isoform X3 [Anguilla anguilla]